MSLLRLFVLLGVLPSAAVAQVATLEIIPNKATVVAGQELRPRLPATDASGREVAPPQVIWMVGPFDVASVTQAGVVKALRHGTAQLLARVGGKVASAEIQELELELEFPSPRPTYPTNGKRSTRRPGPVAERAGAVPGSGRRPSTGRRGHSAKASAPAWGP
ncbi:MAG: Ig domain-containing protein [Gemmatimonadales bacterium]